MACAPTRASPVSLIGLLNLFADEWPRPSFAILRKGKPASFRLFPVGSYVVVCGAGSFLPTLVGLLRAIRWCVCHYASCPVSTPSTNALASDSLSAGGPLGLIGGTGLPSFGCGHGQGKHGHDTLHGVFSFTAELERLRSGNTQSFPRVESTAWPATVTTISGKRTRQDPPVHRGDGPT